MNTTAPFSSLPDSTRIAFIGGGNMASAIIGGLRHQGVPSAQIVVVEPLASQREQLQQRFGVQTLAQSGPDLGQPDLVVWAVKPQIFKTVAQDSAPWVEGALHLSVAAGIRSDSMVSWLHSERIVRAMPNTPALVGQGTTGLFARTAVAASDRDKVQEVLGSTGLCLWVHQETDLDAVTALSGSGPAYVFYFLEAMRQAGTDMGLDAQTATRLAIETFAGAALLARSADEAPEVLRERVTSKGGTTHAALTSMEQQGVKAAFVQAMHAAHRRAQTLGDEFGA